jgi:PAS domain S-box-containing protein
MSLEQFFKLRFRVGISVADANGKALAVDDGLCEIFGRPREELMTAGIFDRISHPDDLARERPLLQALLAGDRDGYTIVKRYQHANGEEIRGLVDVVLVRTETGNPQKAVGLVVAEAKHTAGDQQPDETIGTYISRLRRERGLSLRDLDLGAGLTWAAVSRLERDLRQPTVRSLMELARVFDVRFIVDGDGVHGIAVTDDDC